MKYAFAYQGVAEWLSENSPLNGVTWFDSTSEGEIQMKKIEQVITSVEVADMLEIRHSDILRKIEGYVQVLGERKIALADYFKESTYQDAQDKPRKCYLITKMGCDFLANKFTGEKGILFTAKYVKRFHQMQEQIATSYENISMELQAVIVVDQRVTKVENRVKAVQADLNEFKQDLPLLGCDMDRITSAVRKMGVNCLGGKESNAYADKSLRGKVYSDIYEQLKRQFGVTSYKNIKRSELDDALGVIRYYLLPIVLRNEIMQANSQMRLKERK